MALKKEKRPSNKPVVDLKDAWIDSSMGKDCRFLWGRPTNHDIGALNGTLVHTSFIVAIEGNVVETKRSVYNILNWEKKPVAVQTELF